MTSPFTLDLPRIPSLERDGAHWWARADGREVRLSNLDKVFWPDEGITKGDLVAYYASVAPVILPYLAGRPLTMKRMPDGVRGGHFYQKDAPDHTPPWVTRCAIEPEDGQVDEMLVVEDVSHLLYVVNLGCIELHPLHGRCERYDRPDYLVFDLDPFHPAAFPEVLAVARHVGAALDHLGLRGLPKTSGATGLQVYVPVARGHTYEETRGLTERIGRMILQADPELVTMEWPVARREGRIFIDHNMNRRGASLAAAYSVRPLPGAPVSAPLTWEEVRDGDVRPDWFTITSVFPRLRDQGDMFRPVLDEPQDLTEALRLLGVPRGGSGEAGRIRRLIPPDRGGRDG